ncbi:MAG: hypothetical protein M3516_06070 [Actinomycetota bacterium]|nr:hypothetical protein [Actinomycetota bacterium]
MDDRTFFYAIVCGPLYIGALLGLWLIVAPGAALKWRAKILKDKQRGRVATRVERWLRAGGPEPWENQSAITRMKLVGLGILLRFAAAAYVLVAILRPHF